MKSKKKAPGPVLVVFGLFFSGMAMFFVAHLFDNVSRQAHLFAVAQPVSATVIGSDIKTVWVKKRSRYEVVISYRYEFEGKSYQSDQYYPAVSLGRFKEHTDALTFSKPFPVGAAITAFHDPRAPQDSFLVRKIDFEPYSGIVFVMIHFSIGLALVLFNVVRSKNAVGAVRRWGIVLGLWTIVGTIALIHYAAVGGELDRFSGGFATGFVVVTLLLAWWWSRISAKAMNGQGNAAGDEETRGTPTIE